MDSSVSLGMGIGEPRLAKWGTPAVIDDDALLAQYVREPHHELKAELTRRFSALAERLARRYSGKGEPLEDLEQVAHVGLAKAIDGFDPERRRAFHSYAVPTILGELRRHFRDHCWGVHVPRGVKDLGMKLPGAIEELAGELGREPTVEEIGTLLGASTEDVVEVVLAQQAARPARLDAPVERSGAENGELAEIVGSEDPNFALAEDRMVVAERLDRLDDRQREVLRMRFGEDLSQSEIAARIGLSQMQVSRILRRALDRLQAE